MENVVELTEEQKAADDYRAMLSQKVMRVVFNKKDGTERPWMIFMIPASSSSPGPGSGNRAPIILSWSSSCGKIR